MLSRIFGAGNTMNPNQQGGLMQGDHNLDSNRVLGVSKNAITPTKATGFKQVESAPACREARYFTPGETAALGQLAQHKREGATASEQAFRHLSSIQRSDTRVQKAHRRYVGVAAGCTLEKKAADVALGTQLQKMRLPYTQLGAAYNRTQQQENSNIASFMHMVRTAM